MSQFRTNLSIAMARKRQRDASFALMRQISNERYATLYTAGEFNPHYLVPAIPLMTDFYPDCVVIQRAYVQERTTDDCISVFNGKTGQYEIASR